MIKNIWRLCFFLGVACQALGAEEELLKKADIHKVMQQIFKAHVEKKEMTATILQNAFEVYIDQFDPYRIYLLADEVNPFLTLTQLQFDSLLQEYRNKDLSAFERLNAVIQKSIVRSRTIREALEKKPQMLLEMANHPQNSFEEVSHFPQNSQELQQRIQQGIAQYLQQEGQHFGEKQVRSNLVKTLQDFETKTRQIENQYLAIDDSGLPLNASESENLFSMHVLKSLANSLDAHTKVLNSNEAYEMKIRLEKAYQGIGIRISKKGKEVIVAELIDASPAAKSGGIKINDRITKIDQRIVENEPLSQILEMLRGPDASLVNLTLQRPGQEQPIQLQLRRDTIPVNDGRVESSFEKFGNGIIGKIGLHSFYQGENDVTSEQDLRRAIAGLKKEGTLRGLIIDLRDDTGGFLTQAVKVAGLFVSSGVIVISKYSSGEERFYRDVDGTVSYDGPLVVLVSKETASAAEIVAQALQDYGIALVVGDERTYGKGTIQSQTVTNGNNGSASYFKVTVGKYYTVSGNTPQLQGVKADIIVPSVVNHLAIGEEYLEGAVTADKIPAEYKDSLADVEPNLKPWYLHYYTPKLQPKRNIWQPMLPALRKNSAKRIANNKEYQAIMQQAESSIGLPSFRENDPQMEEAVNIVKDMILLQQSKGTLSP
ncbi:MAG: PDZ domain-containing protein [Parachlamydiaceae bacterium]|nr:PDZ domain-containing protein [Parachlamydiaceae bacterium]